MTCFAMVVAGCSPQGRQSDPTSSSIAPAVAGNIRFGISIDERTQSIKRAQTSFPASGGIIVWSANLREPAGATSLTFVLSSVAPDGSETAVVRQAVRISRPTMKTLTKKGDLASLAGNRPGTYSIRYLRGDLLLASGTFYLSESGR